MYFTNGRVLVHKFNSDEKLQEAVSLIEEYMNREHAIEMSLQIFEEDSWKKANLPSELKFEELESVLKGQVQFKAIAQDELVLLGTTMKTIKHIFSTEERQEIASTNAEIVREWQELEEEKKSIVADYNKRVQDLEAKIKSGSELYRNGYEMRDVNCLIKIDFAGKKKYYLDKENEGDVLAVEDARPNDMQLRIDAPFEPGLTVTHDEEAPI
jgi:hypothetical protein